MDGSDEPCTALVKPNGLYFYFDFIVPLIKNALGQKKNPWLENANYRDIQKLLPQPIKLESIDVKDKHNRDVYLEPEIIPPEVLKAAYSKAIASGYAKGF